MGKLGTEKLENWKNGKLGPEQLENWKNGKLGLEQLENWKHGKLGPEKLENGKIGNLGPRKLGSYAPESFICKRQLHERTSAVLKLLRKTTTRTYECSVQASPVGVNNYTNVRVQCSSFSGRRKCTV